MTNKKKIIVKPKKIFRLPLVETSLNSLSAEERPHVLDILTKKLGEGLLLLMSDG